MPDHLKDTAGSAAGRIQPASAEGRSPFWAVSTPLTEEQARDAVRWVSGSLGIKHDDLVQAAGFIGHPDAPNVTLNEAIERYGNDPISFTLCMVMLCGGLVATVGNADPDWLKQFDLPA
ncbi:hypothetical protein [Streptomyces sp. NPDC059063]|uniref:hypothetical protein n=1 Tax=unclassified Streptomyces TaxID=2593676 RepID=UPI0036AE339C